MKGVASVQVSYGRPERHDRLVLITVISISAGHVLVEGLLLRVFNNGIQISSGYLELFHLFKG